MPHVEIKIVLNTENGELNIEFFAPVEGMFFSEDEVIDKIGEIIEKKISESGINAKNGYATAYHENEELFMMSFMRTDEGEIEGWKKMEEMTNLTVH
jgi:hypothetical protein|tara:strand:- start:329 stop:619 length:291 start_codon:yes stop_codon:yes gene_type:complete